MNKEIPVRHNLHCRVVCSAGEIRIEIEPSRGYQPCTIVIKSTNCHIFDRKKGYTTKHTSLNSFTISVDDASVTEVVFCRKANA